MRHTDVANDDQDSSAGWARTIVAFQSTLDGHAGVGAWVPASAGFAMQKVMPWVAIEEPLRILEGPLWRPSGDASHYSHGEGPQGQWAAL